MAVNGASHVCVCGCRLSLFAVTRELDEEKQVDMNPAGQPEQAGCGK